MATEYNVLALIKGEECFLFTYTDDSLGAVIKDIRDKAADPSCTLNWFDAGALIARARTQVYPGDPK
jgi:hypothetical protein